jgi:hypothetical protein
VDDKRQGDDVLPPAQESFGAIDRIERPETGPTRTPPTIDPRQHLLRLHFAAWQHLANQPHDSAADLIRGVCSKCACVLLRHERIGGEMPREARCDERLHDEVCDRDWRPVCLGERTRHRTRLSAAHEAGRMANHFTGDDDDRVERVYVHRMNGTAADA